MPEILPTMPSTVEASLRPGTPWKRELAEAVRSSRDLCEILRIPASCLGPIAESDFPVLVPRSFVNRMQPGNPKDPLLLQVIASREEEQTTGVRDPVHDLEFQNEPGLLQKYDHRALIVATGACAVHCRYCFRRHFPYDGLSLKNDMPRWLDKIASDPSIEEVILSGGDPLSNVDDTLAEFVDRLNQIPTVTRLRVHTRFPVVIPSRICNSLVKWVENCRAACFFVLHFNHRQEIDDEVLSAITRLRKAGATLLNQTVLLKGINDQEEALVSLFKQLVDIQVLPYYLHQLDPVQGAMHFEVTDEVAVNLISACRSRLPGYAVPTLVREIPGRPSKSPISFSPTSP